MSSQTFNRIRDKWVPEFLAHLESKNKDYTSDQGVENHTVLGPAGQFADIWRKIPKLRKALWDGGKLEHEQVTEVIMDMIGHLFLTFDMLASQPKGWPAPGATARPNVIIVDKDSCHSCGHSLAISHTRNGCHRIVAERKAGQDGNCPCAVVGPRPVEM